jgi:hypothetical protein
MTTVTTWSFQSGLEDWTIRDDSTPDNGSESTLTYDSGAEAMEQNAFIPAISFSLSRGWLLSPTLDVPTVSGDTIEMDVSALTGGPLVDTTRRVKAIYTDETSEEQTAVGQGAVTVTLTISAEKTLSHIELVAVEIGNGISPTSYDLFCDVFEVRLTTETPPPGFQETGLRPLELDLDLYNGNKLWTTVFDGGGFELRHYSSDLVLQSTYAIVTGTVSISDVNNRVYYATPHAPAFFGESDLTNLIFAFGRWDDGSVKHIIYSTNGGSSFSDIGDSATWGTGWVGGFLADDANTLYAFVNGGSRALYRSTDGGSTWTNLSSLPFDVEPGGVSKHPDDRILIVNRAAEAQMAAYAEAPDYSVWFDATGSPSFPTAGGGANAVIWIT